MKNDLLLRIIRENRAIEEKSIVSGYVIRRNGKDIKKSLERK